MSPQFTRTRLLILCKTYPSPSEKYTETSCIAAMTEEGRLIRLYPVPFRLLEESARFSKWQWIEADIAKASNDHRQESHRVRADTLTCLGDPLSTRNLWAERRPWLEKLRSFRSFAALERARTDEGVTLGLLRQPRIASLQSSPVRDPEWTEDELAKLTQLQGDLFADPERLALRRLRKLPYEFHYEYRGQDEPASVLNRHKIVDWEVGALYWNVVRDGTAGWEQALRRKLEQELPAADLMLLMGTIHRFPDQWLIVSLIYPPRQEYLRLL